MSGFQSPNYTQTPNDFFEMLPDMSDAEIRVTLVMIRKTLGFHREGFKMGIAKLAAAAGLSRQGALDGARAAEERGTFRRTNPEAQTEAEWELILEEPLNVVDTHLKPVEGKPQASRGQVRVKENIKKYKKEIKEGASAPKQKPPKEQRQKLTDIPELVVYREVVRHWPKQAQRDIVIKAVQKINGRLGRAAVKEDLDKFWLAWNKVSGNEWSLVWLDWAVSGNIPTNGNGHKPSVQQSYDAIDRVLGV